MNDAAPQTADLPATTPARRMSSAERLAIFIARIERAEEEAKSARADVTEIFRDAKLAGFDPNLIRAVIKLRKVPPGDREEYDSMVQVYMDAIEANERKRAAATTIDHTQPTGDSADA